MFFNLIKPDTSIDFVSIKNYCIGVSVAIILLGCVSVLYHGGLKMGIDFAGGTLVQVKFANTVSSDEVRDILEKSEIGAADVQAFGSDKEVIVRLGHSSDKFKEPGVVVKEVLDKNFSANPSSIERVEMVGPKVGSDLRNKAILAIAYTLIAIILFISWRFEFRFGVAAIIALFHDMLVMAAFMSFFDLEFTLQIVAAFLTILGYSINDTIVVFDRIRENLKVRRKDSLGDVVNLSINGTLSRSVITSLTVFFVVVVLLVFGGSVIHDFAFALTVGVVAGTYSSIYIAAPILLFWQKFSRSSLAPSKKEAV